jgi:Flp pilus assembly pilin Flp
MAVGSRCAWAEPTLIAALISIAAIATMRTVGGKISNVLANVSNAMT